MADQPASHSYMFDPDGARKAGYSDAEIANFLARQSGFDVDSARKAGYGDGEIISHLAASPIHDGGYLTKDETPAQARAETDATNRAATTPGLEREIGQGVTANFGDELDGAMAAGETGANNLVRRMTGQPSVGYGMSDAYHAVVGADRQAQGAYEKQHPYLAAAGQIGGAVISPEARLAGGFVARGVTPLARVGRASTAGAMTGAVAGAGAGDGDLAQRAQGALGGAMTGAAVGGALGGASEGGRAVVGPAAEGQAPTLEQLTAQKDAAYKAVDDSGVKYTPEAFKGLTENMANALDDAGFHAGLHPKTAAMMERIGASDRAVGGYSPTLGQLDQLRQQIGSDIAGSSDPGERRMGQILRGQIDDFIDKAGPAQITGGDPAAAAQTISAARDLNTRVAKLRSLDNLDEAAADRASVTGSGGNVNNTTRQNVVRFKNNTGNLTSDEQAAAQRVIDGTPVGNAMRMVGKLSPEGNGLAALAHTSSLAAELGSGHAPMAMTQAGVAMTGAVAKRIADAMTTRNVQALRELIARGGNAAEAAAMPDEEVLARAKSGRLLSDLTGRAVTGASDEGATYMTRNVLPQPANQR